MALVLTLALFGGASRADSLAQIPVRLASLVLIAVVFALHPAAFRALTRPPGLFLALFTGLVAVQLVPLPPALWQALPGRQLYTEIGRLVDQPALWRPLAIDPDAALNALFSLLPAIATFLVLTLFTPTRTAPLVIAVVGLASLALGFAQLAAGPESGLRWFAITTGNAPVGFFANRNHQALLIAAAIPAIWVAYRLRTDGTLREQVVALGLIGFMLLGVLVNGSRAGVLLAGVGLIAAFCVPLGYRTVQHRRAGDERRGRQRLYAFAALAVVLALASWALLSQAQTVDRLMTAELGEDMRVRAAPLLGDMTRSYFPWGSGFGSFPRVFRHWETTALLDITYFNHAHNDLLELAIEGGLPALVLLAAFVAWAILQAVRTWRVRQWRDPAVMLARLGSVLLVLVALASATDYPVRTPLGAALFIAGCWLLAEGRPVNGEESRRSAFTH